MPFLFRFSLFYFSFHLKHSWIHTLQMCLLRYLSTTGTINTDLIWLFTIIWFTCATHDKPVNNNVDELTAAKAASFSRSMGSKVEGTMRLFFKWWGVSRLCNLLVFTFDSFSELTSKTTCFSYELKRQLELHV